MRKAVDKHAVIFEIQGSLKCDNKRKCDNQGGGEKP